MYTLFAMITSAEKYCSLATSLRPRFINFTATLDKLMSFQRILPRERLAASPITQVRLFAGVCLPMAFQVMLAVERQRAHVARKGPRRRCGVLAVARGLRERHLLRILRVRCHYRGRLLRHIDGMRPRPRRRGRRRR